MTSQLYRKYGTCIEVSEAKRKIRSHILGDFNLSRDGGPMKMKNKSALLALGALLVLGATQVRAQKPSKGQCSLAVVSRLVNSKQPVCSSKVVQQMAQQG